MGVSTSPAAIPRIRSDNRDSRLTTPCPTQSQAVSVAAVTLATLITANNIRPSSKLRTDDSNVAEDSARAPANRTDRDSSRAAAAPSKFTARALALARNASC